MTVALRLIKQGRVDQMLQEQAERHSLAGLGFHFTWSLRVKHPIFPCIRLKLIVTKGNFRLFDWL